MGVTMFYAEFCPYGIRTISDGDTLMAFETREERDEMVGRINYANELNHPEGCAVAVTTHEVSHRYNFNDFKNDNAREVPYNRTCRGRCFFEIRHKPSYKF
jgi:hypothetical protein